MHPMVIFDAARITLKIPRSHGFTGDVSYWFSKAIDTGSGYTNMAAGDEALQGYSQSQSPVAQDLKGPSSPCLNRRILPDAKSQHCCQL
jgi:hypothetical protein